MRRAWVRSGLLAVLSCGAVLGCGAVVGCAAEEGAPLGVDAWADVGTATDSAGAGDAVEGDLAVGADGGSGAVESLPPRICHPGAVWAPGQSAFTDVTAESGLSAMGVTGIRLSAADWDGDGFCDLSVRSNVPGGRDDFSEGGERLTWFLKGTGDLRFVDVTESSGLTQIAGGGAGRTSQIVVFGDVDNDGDLDVFNGVNSQDPSKDAGDRSVILLNRGDGTFELAEASDVNHEGQWVSTMAASFLDVDKDGFLDLFVGFDVTNGQFAQDRLYLGDGSGAFTDRTAMMGIANDPVPTLAALNAAETNQRSWGTATCDLNDDGWPDLVTATYGRGPNGLWLSDGAGGFLRRSVESHVAFDALDDWTSNPNAQCFCALVPGAPGCAGVPDPPTYFPCTQVGALRWNHDTDREPYRLGGNTFGLLCGDLNNDLHNDLFSLEIVHWDVGETSDPSQILLNNGAKEPVFERLDNASVGLVRDFGTSAWNAGDITGGLLDFDLDGRLDILIGSSDYPGTRAFLFHQKADGTFEEVPAAFGIDQPRALGVAVADFDGDGDPDVAIGHSRMRCNPGAPDCYPTQEVHLFRNDLFRNDLFGNDSAGGNWLEVALQGGPGTNRAGIGAQVRVTAGGLTQLRTVDGGMGHFGGQNTTSVRFGLGSACDIDRVEVRWPNAQGTVEVFDGVLANYRVRLTQGGGVTYPFWDASR